MFLPFSLCINFIRYFFSICQETKGTQKPILSFICDHMILICIRLTHSLFCSISYLLQHIKPLHDVLWNVCSIKSSIPVPPASFLKMVFIILLQQKPPFKIDVGERCRCCRYSFMKWNILKRFSFNYVEFHISHLLMSVL